MLHFLILGIFYFDRLISPLIMCVCVCVCVCVSVCVCAVCVFVIEQTESVISANFFGNNEFLLVNFFCTKVL